jgi:hypothetical protein
MKHRVDLMRVEASDQAASLLGRYGVKLHAPTVSLLRDLEHDRQRAMRSRADDQSISTPREFLGY